MPFIRFKGFYFNIKNINCIRFYKEYHPEGVYYRVVFMMINKEEIVVYDVKENELRKVFEELDIELNEEDL